MLATLIGSYLVIGFVRSLLSRWYTAPESGESAHIPPALGVAAALAAGITEEFIYRRFLIEELGEVLHNRRMAGAVSVVAFALAHVHAGYSWSPDLLIPGLMGVALTILYFRRASLPLCVLLHVLVDLLSEFARRA